MNGINEALTTMLGNYINANGADPKTRNAHRFAADFHAALERGFDSKSAEDRSYAIQQAVAAMMHMPQGWTAVLKLKVDGSNVVQLKAAE